MRLNLAMVLSVDRAQSKMQTALKYLIVLLEYFTSVIFSWMGMSHSTQPLAMLLPSPLTTLLYKWY